MMINIKTSYSKDEVDSAQANLRLLRTACPLKLTKENQETFLTYIIGTDDEFSLYPILSKINTLTDQIQKIPFNLNGLYFDKQDQKNKAELDKLHANLKVVYGYVLVITKESKFQDKINGISNAKDAYSLLLPIPDGINSAMLSIAFDYISVHPPLNTTAYKALSNAISQNSFISYNLGLKNESSYAKYIAGQTQPSEVNWGILLLALGIHPVYEIKHKYSKPTLTALSKFNISVNNLDSFNADFLTKIKRLDFKKIPKSIKLLSKDKSLCLQPIQTALFSKIQKKSSSTRYTLITNKLDVMHKEYTSHPSSLIKIRKYLQHLVTSNIIENKDAIAALSYYSTPLDKINSDININNQFGSFANFIQLSYYPSPTIFTILQKKLNLDFLKKNHFNTKYLYWYNLERSEFQATSIYYSFILLSLNLHPIYTLSIRTDNEETSKIFSIFKDFHKATIQSDDAVFIKEDENFAEFAKRYDLII